MEKDRKLRYQSAADLKADLALLKRDTDSGRSVVDASIAEEPPRPWWRSGTAIVLAGVVLVILGMAAGLAYRFAGRGETIDSVAVLPFVNASGDPDSRYLSDGITESLINSLSQLPHLAVFYFARQYDQAIEQLRKTQELDSNYAQPQRDLVLAYAQKSMYKEAVAEGDKRLAVAPDDRIALAFLGYAYAKAARKAEAQKVLDQLNDLSKREYVPARRRTIIYAGLGEKDRAFEWMEKAYNDRELGVGFGSIKVDPAYDPLRSDPRLADLLRRMNLQP